MSTHDPVERVRHRRAIGLLAMGAIVPGSAQFVLGNRTVGRWALRLWAAGVLAVLVTALALVFFRASAVEFLLTGWVTTALRILAWAAFVGWVVLLVDAWRLGRPPQLRRKVRLGMTLACLGLVVAAGFATSVVAQGLTAVHTVGTVFSGGGEREEQRGRFNILLLGVDAADGRDGLRPDSINVASVDAETGRTLLFGLPRNLQRVRFPTSSPLHDEYPRGYVCGDGSCMLNAIYTLGVDHAELYPDAEDPGLQAMKEAVSETLGIDLNYYVMIDMGGFASLIDAMGGITVNVHKPIPIGGGGSPVSGYIGPGEGLHLDGDDALWLARSRHGSSDYERMVRQKCVMNAMASQLNPMTVATQFTELSEAGAGVVSTDIGADHVSDLVDLALRAKDLPIESVNFVPPMIVAADPDHDLIHEVVQDTIAESQALDDEAPEPAMTGEPSPTPSTSEPPAPSNPTEDVVQESPTPRPDNTGAATPDTPADGEEPGEEYGGNPNLAGVCSVG